MGRMTLASQDDFLVRVEFGAIDLPFDKRPSETTNAAANQIQEYLAGKRKRFDVSLKAQGSDFQHRVWDEISRIPYGETRTYAQVAQAVGNPKAFRAVGMAAHRNPLPLFVPCHRVIGANGALTGFAGGLKIKEFLLNLEQEN